MRSEQEIRDALEKVESHLTGDEDSQDPVEVIRETFLFVLGYRRFDSSISDYLPES